jgi:hypothetical protein
MSPGCPTHGGQDNILLEESEETRKYRCVTMDHIFYQDKQSGKTRLDA